MCARISATLSCPMQLQKFPMDTQICPMSFESCQYYLLIYSYLFIFFVNKPDGNINRSRIYDQNASH